LINGATCTKQKPSSQNGTALSKGQLLPVYVKLSDLETLGWDVGSQMVGLQGISYQRKMPQG
jgi:hypothetical protein